MNDPSQAPSDQPELFMAWDGCFCDFWSASLSEALKAAEMLFASDAPDEPSQPTVENHIAAEFWRVLQNYQPSLPATSEERYQAVRLVLRVVIQHFLQNPSDPRVEDYIAVALRPVRRLRMGRLTQTLCTALYCYQRGDWSLYLTKPQLNVLLTALRKTLAALPPDQMGPFWEGLQDPNPMKRSAMRLGLELLCSTHSTPHLLNGLEQSSDHDIRSAIVDRLEQIADPRALATLIRLRRETAQTDWTLSRHIARAIQVIEHQNRNQSSRTLLRPTTPYPRELLRPAFGASPEQDFADQEELLRPDLLPNEPNGFDPKESAVETRRD